MMRRRLPRLAPAWLVLAIVALLVPSALAAYAAHGARQHTAKAATHHFARRAHRDSSGAGPDVLLGDASVEANRGHAAAGTVRAFRFDTRSPGSATVIHLYVDTTSRAMKVMAALYGDDHGRPGALLGAGRASAVAGTWNSVPIDATAVAAGGRYWIAVLGQGGGLVTRHRSHGGCAMSSLTSRLQFPPARWQRATAGSTCPISAYATSTADRMTPERATVAVAGSPVLLGSQNLASVRDASASGFSEAFGYTATASGNAAGITVWLDSSAGARVALYSDKAGCPGARLATGSVASNAAESWVGASLGFTGDREWNSVLDCAVGSRRRPDRLPRLRIERQQPRYQRIGTAQPLLSHGSVEL